MGYVSDGTALYDVIYSRLKGLAQPILHYVCNTRQQPAINNMTG
jgi:hypothetical protein